jgi:hypothetical protein
VDCAELILKEPEDGSRSFFLHPVREGSGANECDDRSAVPDLPGDHYDRCGGTGSRSHHGAKKVTRRAANLPGHFSVARFLG